MASPRLSGFRSEHVWREAAEPVYWLDKTLRPAWVNPAWEALTGYPGREFLDMARGALGVEGINAVGELIAAIQPPPGAREGLPASHLTTLTSKTGERTTHRVDFWPFRDADDV